MFFPARDAEDVYPTQALVLRHDCSREGWDTTFAAIVEEARLVLVQLVDKMKAGRIGEVIAYEHRVWEVIMSTKNDSYGDLRFEHHRDWLAIAEEDAEANLDNPRSLEKERIAQGGINM